MKWFKGHMPDITPAQAVAAMTWCVTQAIAWGWVDNDAGQKFISAAGTVISGVWVLADMLLRSARNKRMAEQKVAEAAVEEAKAYSVAQPK